MRFSLLFRLNNILEKNGTKIITLCLSLISIASFFYFYQQNLGLAYNDARSHLDIGRRVVEGLKPGLAQLGSVWLPLPHFLMIATIWNSAMWHSGLAGAINSMISYVATGIYIWLILKKLKVGPAWRFLGVGAFALNANILYLQSTAMTEVLLLLTLTAAIYELICWSDNLKRYSMIKAAFWIMLSTLIRYEGWFLFIVAAAVIYVVTLKRKGKKEAEGTTILFSTLAGFGILLWFVWNKMIFGDFLYFAFGPYSAHAQQKQLQAAGDLLTKGNILFSLNIYSLASYFTIGAIVLAAGFLGSILIFFDTNLKTRLKIISVILLTSPIVFNILALFMGHSVLFIEGINGKSWFNVRYGVMALPAAAVFGAYFASQSRALKVIVLGLILAASIFPLSDLRKSVTVEDALYGSSGKDVSQIAGWLKNNVKDKNARVLVSAASHDAVIFSSGLPMSQIIHEGTGPFWDASTTNPDHWAKYIVMRTYDVNDSTFKLLENNKAALSKYDLVYKGNFADIYELKSQYNSGLSTNFTLTAFENENVRKVEDAKISNIFRF